MAYRALEQPRVGWIGAGRMGLQMASRLLDAGYDVAVYNRTASKAAPMVSRGAVAVDSPADLAGRDVVFTMVSGSDDLLQVTTGAHGVLTDPDRSPKLLVDFSTVSMEASAAVRAAAAELGTEVLAAPVSGNPKVVSAGQLSLAVSGDQDTFAAAEPLLALFGARVTYVGEGEVARLVKICHNVLLGVVIQALSEVTVLAEKGGTSRAAFLEFINYSVLGSMFTRYKSPALVNLDFTPTFTNPLLLKDFDLGLAAAHDLQAPMPVASAAAAMVASALGAGYRTEDFATLILEQARRSGITLTAENVKVDDGLEAS
ncbi:MAG: NAD(P)-dependent oxidoreductase [Actinomycetota bacterium]|nr:NAD(P)-dependent oxidoreductase [Actinomycetota bacterium]